MPKHTLINAKELRNVVIRAVQVSGLSNQIKIKYPFENGHQIDINYNEVKDLFNFAMQYGKLLNEINPEKFVDAKHKGECNFFCCAHCNAVGIEKRDKLFINICIDCAAWHVIERDHKNALKRKELEEKIKVSVNENAKFSPYLKEQEIKNKVKLINPVKLKHKTK